MFRRSVRVLVGLGDSQFGVPLDLKGKRVNPGMQNVGSRLTYGDVKDAWQETTLRGKEEKSGEFRETTCNDKRGSSPVPRPGVKAVAIKWHYIYFWLFDCFIVYRNVIITIPIFGLLRLFCYWVNVSK